MLVCVDLNKKIQLGVCISCRLISYIACYTIYCENESKQNPIITLMWLMQNRFLTSSIGALLILWPIFWAIFDRGSNPPSSYLVFVTLLLGSFILALTSLKRENRRADKTKNALSVLIMTIFWLVTGLFVYYIGSLILYAQLMQ